MRAPLLRLVLLLGLPLAACSGSVDQNGGVDGDGTVDLYIGDYRDPDDGPCFPNLNLDGGGMCAPGTPAGQVCNYALVECTCLAPENTWLCCQGDPGPSCADSPTQPKNGAPCCLAGDQVCTYGGCVGGMTTSCGCVNNHWMCMPDVCQFDDGGNNLDMFLFNPTDGGA